MTTTLPKTLTDMPSYLSNGWTGYSHFPDPTMMPFNILTFPSFNCTVPNSDKIVPDKGKTLLGQAFTENTGINGHKQKFKNLGGLEMEVRTFPSLDANLKDVVEIYYLNDRLLFSTLVGAFQIGETVTGGTSGETGIISNILNTVLTLTNITGDFLVGETITGSQSGATAVIVSAPISAWHRITQNVNPLARGTHEVYFDEWFDTLLPNTIPGAPVSKDLPRLIWVNGIATIFSWTGGVALITSITATNIIIDPSTSWKSLGFTTDALGNAYVIVNGVQYTLTTPADLNTNSINVTSTAGISVGDIATSKIETDVAPIPFDMARANQGFMFYGNWNNRNLYMSNRFNREYNYALTSFQALNNDIVFDTSSAYTGTTQSVFHIVIDSVEPNTNVQEFIATGNGLDDARYITTGYSGAAGVLNVYRVVIVADYVFVYPAGPSYQIGEVVTGSVSLATARVVAEETANPGGTMTQLAVVMLSGEFVAGDTLTGEFSGAVNVTGAGQYNNWIQYYVNDVQTNLNSLLFTGPTIPILDQSFPPSTSLITLTDGLTIRFGNSYGHAIGDTFKLTIRTGGQDTFKWQKDGGPVSVLNNITGAFQPLSDGVSIKFLNLTGHEIGDFWDITASPSVGIRTVPLDTRAFANFYYNTPVRAPGEGYIFILPSNFWTMDTQEDAMYVNTSYGEWGFVTATLAGDLLSEAIALTPLKQSGANKVLYPYLTGHIQNDLVYISVTKTLDFIGRQQFLEKPQVGYLSDPVKLDFEASNFIGGCIKYLNKRLYISSPQDAIMHVYDVQQKYWQPPKSFPEVALLSIFGNDLISHSNVRNQTFTMFASTSGDNGQNYTVSARTPYTSVGSRWNSKFSNMSFTEGYIRGNPVLKHTVYLEVNGCGGILPHTISPIVCVSPDRAPFGEGPFGSHAFGSDLGIEGSYFQEIYKAYSPVMDYYFLSIGIECTAKSHTWSILAMGMNGMYSTNGNNNLVNINNLPQS